MIVFKRGDLVRKKHMERDSHTLGLVMDHNVFLESINRLRVCFVTDGKTEFVVADDYEIVSKNKEI